MGWGDPTPQKKIEKRGPLRHSQKIFDRYGTVKKKNTVPARPIFKNKNCPCRNGRNLTLEKLLGRAVMVIFFWSCHNGQNLTRERFAPITLNCQFCEYCKFPCRCCCFAFNGDRLCRRFWNFSRRKKFPRGAPREKNTETMGLPRGESTPEFPRGAPTEN